MGQVRRLQHAVGPRRAVALIRVSKERDGMTSPDVQRHAIESFAAQNRITIVDTIEGLDESGSRAKSAWWPRLDSAIARLEAGEFDTILVWKYSRTARNRLRWAVALDRVDIAGGRIISATEPIESDSASGRFARGMLGEMNAYQADLIGETWRETLDRRVREGLPASGRPRFGYLWDRTYTPDPDTAPVVREMYRRALTGHGMASITRWLNDQGHRTRYGNLWQTIGTTRYMDRGFAAGKIWSAGVLHPGAHEPLIDAETWEAYLARRASTHRTPRGTRRMASGLVRCATCKGPMMATRTTGDSSHYGCAARARGGICDAPATISRHILEQALSDWIAALPQRAAELRAAAEQEAAQRTTMIEDRAALSRLIRRAEERLAKLTMRLVDEKITDAAYAAAAAPLNAELDALNDRFRRAAPQPRRDLLAEIPALVEGWGTMTHEQQNRVARNLIDRIIVRRGAGPDRIQIVPRWATTN